MLKTFPIDFVRQILEQKLLEEHMIDVNLFGGKEQVAITSFYEQLKSQDEVNRFIETYRDLTEQQNRTGLILNGVLLSPENPTITNLYSSLIVPMTWTCSLRCTLENRDNAIITINNLIEKLKGRKVDVAQLNCIDENGKPYTIPFCVGTIGQTDGEMYIKNGDYLGNVIDATSVAGIITSLRAKGLSLEAEPKVYFYVRHQNKLKVVEQSYYSGTGTYSYQFVEDDGTITRIVFPPEHTGFEQYKVSLSFDAIRCDEPRNLNEKEYCEISFSGSATLVSNGVQLGNDLLKIAVTKLGYQAESYVSFSNAATYLLEPLELPSGNNANTQINQLLANNFVSNTHTDAIALTLQYTFIYDKNIGLLEQWFNYARYGTRGLSVSDITPNLEYKVVEYWCSWGDFENKEIKTKIIENIDIENTESDALTLSLTMQIQGENN